MRRGTLYHGAFADMIKLPTHMEGKPTCLRGIQKVCEGHLVVGWASHHPICDGYILWNLKTLKDIIRTMIHTQLLCIRCRPKCALGTRNEHIAHTLRFGLMHEFWHALGEKLKVWQGVSWVVWSAGLCQDLTRVSW